ncbi:MAG: hypothetical protein NVS9B12_10300 [Vulcanimicrobiaceae bacterium]
MPITLTNSDTSGSTTLSTTTLTAPGTAVTLTYNGSSTLSSAIISATAPGIPASKITSATLTPGSVVKKIASGSGALAIYTNSAGQTYAYLPSASGLLQVLVSSGSTLGSSTGRRTSSSGSNTIGLTPSPDACATDPVHIRLYCIAYTSNVVNVLDLKAVPATVTSTYTTDASVLLSFTGGECIICGAAYDAADDGVILPTANGYELYSAPPANALVKTIPASVSENFGYNAVTNQVWSPHYPGQGSTTGFDLADMAAGKLYTLTPNPTVSEPDQGSVDNGTNIGITSEEFSNNVFLLPFSLAALDSPAPGQFSDPFGAMSLSSTLSAACSTMLDDIAVDSVAHLAFFTGEFCSPGPIGVAQMPSASGPTPTISDWSFVNVPNVPAGVAWNEAHDPHAVAAFNLPPICADCGAIFNLDRSYLAIVDLKKLLAAPRDTVDIHLVASTYDLICNGVVTFIASDPTTNGNSGCAGGSQAINTAGATATGPSAAGFALTVQYGANNAPAGATFAFTQSTAQPPGVSIPSPGPLGTAIAYFSVMPSTSFTYSGANGFKVTSLTVPAWVPPGRIYTLYFYDYTAACYAGNSGPGTLSGGTVTFSLSGGVSGSCPPSSSVSANHLYGAIFTYQ